MIVYHGSPNKFDVFDYGMIRTNGTSEGVGFYFTNNKNIAKGYGSNGYLYTVDFNGKRPLSDNKLTLTKEEAKTIIRFLDDELEFLSNYGDVAYEGYDKVFNLAVEMEYGNAETDTEFMGSLYNACGENELVILTFYKLLNFDHIVSKPEWGGEQTLYIALTNDILTIKNIRKCSVGTWKNNDKGVSIMKFDLKTPCKLT